MREFKIFLVVACFTALVYWGVEPYAHSVLKPHTSAANFNFAEEDLSFAELEFKTKKAELEVAEQSGDETRIKSAQLAFDRASAKLEANKALWAEVAKIDLSKGNASEGKAFFEGNCFACHGLKADGIEAGITDSSLGVLPPDLSSAGLIYDEKFLAALILNPALALKVDHKFPDGTFIMSSYNVDTTGESEELVHSNIANVIAYLKEIGLKQDKDFVESTTKELQEQYAKIEGLNETQKTLMIEKDLAFAKDKRSFMEACVRCHDMRYDSLVALSDKNDLKSYLGSIPPDLSMMIRSRGDEYLHNFINNTQKLLPGTAMPRVGLNETTQKQVVSYMEKIGDSKKEERESLGLYIMGFFAILSIFAILWKRKVWEKLH